MAVVEEEVETEIGNLLIGAAVAGEVGMESGNLLDGIATAEETNGAIESLISMKRLGKLLLILDGARRGVKDGVVVDTSQHLLRQNVSNCMTEFSYLCFLWHVIQHPNTNTYLSLLIQLIRLHIRHTMNHHRQQNHQSHLPNPHRNQLSIGFLGILQNLQRKAVICD